MDKLFGSDETANHNSDQIDFSTIANLPSTSFQSNNDESSLAVKTESNGIQSEESQLLALGISTYDQTELENEVMAQVDECMKVQEEEARQKRNKVELQSILDESRLIKKRLKHIEKALEMAPKESDPHYSKQTKRFITSIKTEKDNKLKQLKRLEGKHKMISKQCEVGVTLESMEKFIQDDDIDVDDETVANLKMMFGEKESSEDILIKTGKMTPFGTVLKNSAPKPKIVTSNNEMTDFEKYLLNQTNLQEKKKKVTKKKKSPSKNQNVVKPKVVNMPVKKSIKNNKKDSQILNKVKNENFSTKLVTDKEGGLTDDSDWLPSGSDMDQNDDGDDIDANNSPKNKQLQKKKKFLQTCSDDSESDNDTRKINKLRTIDDGNQKLYKKRLRRFYKQKMAEDVDSNDSESPSYEEFEGNYHIPNKIWNKLYDYQKIGVRWLWELHTQNCGGILGDEMGLGKTIQIISFLVGLYNSELLTEGDDFHGLGPTLIVCPTTLMHQWVREFHTWWPPFRVAVLHETGSHIGTKESLVRNVHQQNGVIITSYNSVVKHQDLLVPKNWHYVVLDEGHKIRNPDAQITLACKQLKTCHRLLLSGSPVQNNLKELWSLFDFIFPGKLGTLPVFMQQFSVPITQGGYSNATQVQVETSYRCAVVLRDTINPYLLRRMKNDVKTSLHLPDKNEQVLFCKLTSDQVKCYKEYLASKEVHNILNGRLKVFMGLIALRKICNHPDLYSGGPEKLLVANNICSNLEEMEESMKYGYPKRAGKMLVIEALLKLWKKQGHRVLLFSQSRQMLEILEKFVQLQNYTYMRMDGTTSISSRQPAVNKFNSDESIFLFLLTTRVGGLGVNLTGANRVVIYDPDWNPSTDSQARERAWRIGQNKNVTIYRLLSSGTIEEKIYHRQIFKQFLTNKILKDPKQKRFFKNNELHELFTLAESENKGTETSAIFAGTGSNIEANQPNHNSIKKPNQQTNQEFDKKEKMMLLAKRLSKMITDPKHNKTKRKDKSGKIRKSKKRKLQVVDGEVISNVTKQEVFKSSIESDAQKSSKEDDYVLKKLFAKSGVHSALKHDNIMSAGDPDYMLIEGEAEKVAKAAVKALKESRRQCAMGKSGIPTWTGQNGGPSFSSNKKLKFGKKKNLRVLGDLIEDEKNSENKDSSCDDGGMFLGVKGNSSKNKDVSSKSILFNILKRSAPESSSSDENSDNENHSEPLSHISSSLVSSEHSELLSDIQNFIAFQASVDGQATTEELLSRFKDKLPPKDSALFKSLLNEICTFERGVSNHGIWHLKVQFR